MSVQKEKKLKNTISFHVKLIEFQLISNLPVGFAFNTNNYTLNKISSCMFFSLIF